MSDKLEAKPEETDLGARLEKEGIFFLWICLILAVIFIVVFYHFAPPRTKELRETTQQETETKQIIKEKEYTLYKPTNTGYLTIKIKKYYEGPPETPVAEALTEIKEKYETGQVITVNERIYLVEILKEKPSTGIIIENPLQFSQPPQHPQPSPRP